MSAGEIDTRSCPAFSVHVNKQRCPPSRSSLSVYCRHSLSLYANISSIRWDYDNVEAVAGCESVGRGDGCRCQVLQWERVGVSQE